jgi:hypothetical protein
MMCDRFECVLQKVVPARNIRQVIKMGASVCVFADVAAKEGCSRADCAQPLMCDSTGSDLEIEWLDANVSPDKVAIY